MPGRPVERRDFCSAVNRRIDGRDQAVAAQGLGEKGDRAVRQALLAQARPIVSGHDDAILIFRFSNERVNPVIAENAFKFELPEGATWLEGAEAR